MFLSPFGGGFMDFQEFSCCFLTLLAVVDASRGFSFVIGSFEF